MEGDVQRIINISLNKIVASRNRKGGINLHRNLLVASVLFKAKDAYIAETVAKRKRDMDAEAVVPVFDQAPVEEELSDAMEDMETDISRLDIEQSSNCELEESDNLGKDDDFKNEQLKIDSSENSCLEDLENTDSQVELSTKPRPVCSRKRRINDVESPLVDCLNTHISDNNGFTDADSQTIGYESELYTPHTKQIRLDTCNNSSFISNTSETCTEMRKTSREVEKLEYNTSSDNKWNFCIDITNDDDDSDEEEDGLNHNDATDCYRSVCLSGSQNFGGQSFSSQVNVSHSTMLIATM